MHYCIHDISPRNIYIINFAYITITITSYTRHSDRIIIGDSDAGLFCCGRLWYWTILMWEILMLDFFDVGDSDAGLSS